MKKLVLLLVLCAALGIGLWLGRHRPAVAPQPRIAALSHPVSRPTAPPPPAAPAASPAASSSADREPTPDPKTQAFAALIVRASSAGTTLAQRRAIWARLLKAGELNDAIDALKRLSLDNPDDPAVALALGEAEYNELGQIARAGAPFNERAILALQADEDFNQALKLDPTSWEAQFEKASALSHWPANLNKGPEVIQRLSALITQQQSMPPQPEFAESYLILGNVYRAAGQSAKAAQTWQSGLAQFPQNPRLQQVLAGGASQ
jgi:tetratricopeptide (TPR) repeat protein